MKMGIPGRSGAHTRPGLQIRLLGVPQILLEGAPITGLRSSKGQALLFYLAVTGQTYTRASLAALLWGDVSEKAARTNLRKALQLIRKSLNSYVLIDHHTVGLVTEEVWVDVSAFESALEDLTRAEDPARLQEALGLYRGDFLEGFYVRSAPDFETWWLSVPGGQPGTSNLFNPPLSGDRAVARRRPPPVDDLAGPGRAAECGAGPIRTLSSGPGRCIGCRTLRGDREAL